MINFFKNLFGKSETPVAEVPYKVEAPVAEPVPVVKVEEPKTVSAQASEAVVKSVAKPAPKKPAAKKPRKPKATKQPKA
jgi:hypothetical protein